MNNVLKAIMSFLFAGCLVSCSDGSGSGSDYEAGLQVTYSNGVNTVETVIRHGWGADCGETANNLYQGSCTSLDDSPVDWAWGLFTANWSGFIYIPQAGEYTFSAWVDGIVHIEINDSLIADISTVGSAYGKSISFSAANWYPISMTFGANGGSNNMHLGWVKPGSSYATVPKENLGHEK